MESDFLYPNIEAERAKKNLTQQELFDKLGVESKSYYNWLTSGKIPAAILVSLADIFECSVDHLLGRSR